MKISPMREDKCFRVVSQFFFSNCYQKYVDRKNLTLSYLLDATDNEDILDKI